MPYISIFDPSRGVYEFELTKERTVIGRKRSLCDCVIDDSTVSREHAEIYKEGDKYLIKNLSSSGGTVIDGFQEELFRLRDGVNIQIGQIVLEFKEGSPEKKYKIKGTSLTPEEIRDMYLHLPHSLEVHGRYIEVDAANIFNTGDTVAFGKDGVKVSVPEMMLGEYNVLELEIKWPGGQMRTFFTEIIDFSREEKSVYLKFHKVAKESYDKIIEDNKCHEWILLQVPVSN